MSDILNAYTPEQLYTMARDYLLSQKGYTITDFNEGSTIRTILEAFSLITGTTGFDYLDGLRKAIPTALYDGFNFPKKGATTSKGYLRFYREPLFILSYKGSSSSVTLSFSNGVLSLVASNSTDSFTVTISSDMTVNELVDAINIHPNYSATAVKGTSIADIYAYSSVEIIGATDYRNVTGSFDVMGRSATAVSMIATNSSASVDSLSFAISADGSIAAGASSSAQIPAASVSTGSNGNISTGAIDTLNGSGTMNTSVDDVEYVINDSAFSNGTDQETDAERKYRFQKYVQGLYGATAPGLEAAVLGITGVKSVTVKERYPVAGYNTIIADDGTGKLSLDLITEIRKVLDGDADDIVDYPGSRAAGILSQIIPPNVLSVNIVMTIYRLGTTADIDEMINAAKTAVEQYINTLSLGKSVIVSEIIRRVKAVHSAIYDVAISAPSANIPVSKDYIARTGSGTSGMVLVSTATLSAA